MKVTMEFIPTMICRGCGKKVTKGLTGFLHYYFHDEKCLGNYLDKYYGKDKWMFFDPRNKFDVDYFYYYAPKNEDMGIIYPFETIPTV